MELSRSNIAIIFLLVLLIIVWRSEKQTEQQENAVLLVTDDDETVVASLDINDGNRQEDRSWIGRLSGDSSESVLTKEREITDHVEKSTLISGEVPMVVYNLKAPLLPKARLLNFREYQGRLWFAGDAGLYSFDLLNERWFAKERQHGLLRDTAYEIERLESGLYLDLLDWTDEGHLTNSLSVHFDGKQFSEVALNEITAKNGNRPVPKDSKLAGSVSAYTESKGVDWYCYRGRHIDRQQGFDGGGVLAYQSVDKLSKVYLQEQGLLKNYCTGIAIDKEKTVWITHWDEQAGLSYMPSNSTHWQTKVKSKNGVPLGGPSIYAYGAYVFVAQQRALVIYHPESDLAIEVTEQMGLPGFIVTDIQATEDGHVWASSYRYTPNGDGQAKAGLTSITMSDIDKAFSRMISSKRTY